MAHLWMELSSQHRWPREANPEIQHLVSTWDRRNQVRAIHCHPPRTIIITVLVVVIIHPMVLHHLIITMVVDLHLIMDVHMHLDLLMDQGIITHLIHREMELLEDTIMVVVTVVVVAVTLHHPVLITTLVLILTGVAEAVVDTIIRPLPIINHITGMHLVVAVVIVVLHLLPPPITVREEVALLIRLDTIATIIHLPQPVVTVQLDPILQTEEELKGFVHQC